MAPLRESPRSFESYFYCQRCHIHWFVEQNGFPATTSQCTGCDRNRMSYMVINRSEILLEFSGPKKSLKVAHFIEIVHILHRKSVDEVNHSPENIAGRFSTAVRVLVHRT